MTQYPKSTDFQGATFIGKWGKTQTPIYDVPSMHSLNQLVGYVKHINAGNGTVLYRGQCKLYEKVIPSIKHDLSKEYENSKKLNNTLIRETHPPKNTANPLTMRKSAVKWSENSSPKRCD